MVAVHSAVLPSISSRPTVFLHIVSFVLNADIHIYFILLKVGMLLLVQRRISLGLDLFSSKLKFCLLSCKLKGYWPCVGAYVAGKDMWNREAEADIFFPCVFQDRN